MNGLSTEYINSCARQLGAKRLRFELPWEQSPLDDILSSGKKSTIQKPDWVEFPVQLWGPVSTANKPTRLDRYNARTHLSDISWVAVENKKHNLALQCWKVIVLDSTSHTALGQLLMRCIELGKSEDYIWQVVADAFSQKATSTLKSRAASLLAFGRWKRATAAGQPQGIFPLTEEQAYDYLVAGQKVESRSPGLNGETNHAGSNSWRGVDETAFDRIGGKAEIFFPDAPRSRRWKGAQTLVDAVKLASAAFAPDLHQPVVSHSEPVCDEFGTGLGDQNSDSVTGFEVAGEPHVLPGPYSEQNLGFGFGDGFNDDMTLEELKFYRTEDLSNGGEAPIANQDSDISDISSDDSSSVDDDCDSVDLERQAELDGESNARDLVAPSDLAGKKCVRHVKSKKLHFIERVCEGQQFFRCGRKCNANYEHVETVPAFAAHGYMMCFGWSASKDSSDSGD
ncbi:unnamed protein product [Cladocopium goreaui]|uniref:Uncharacterized protein n=1 Tax=Cladocopium goreaui TaxID=2562237 RepID=A0A9P1FPW9_9DINO|nr:unnamed protein product [Cladocopium goreaui]